MTVFVCGSLHLDVIVTAPHLPRIDETTVGTGVSYAFGGKGGNQAVAASRMGADTAMAGQVGSDDFGTRLLSDLTAAGVDATQVRRVPGASGMSVAIIDPSGSYGAVIVSAANLGIDAQAVTIPRGARVLLLQNEIPDPVNRAVAAKARTAGAQVVLNAAPARGLSRDLLALVDVLVVNAVEAADMLGVTDAALDPWTAAARLADLGPRHVIVTLGARGLILLDGEAALYPGHRVTLISTHGAGDSFIGALASRLARGCDIKDACAFGQAAAALHVATPVDRRPLITADQVSAFAVAGRS
jgi:ribokinase